MSIFDLQRRVAELTNTPLTLSEEPKELRRVVQALERQTDRLEPRPSDDVRRAAVLRFMKSGQLKDARQTRYVCFSITEVVTDSGGRVLAQPTAIETLLGDVERLGPLWKRRCYQGILSAYFGEFDGARSESELERRAWSAIRKFLASGLHSIPFGEPLPAWALVLRQCGDFLSETPCDRFADDILEGRTETFDDACKALDISRSCWLSQEAACAATREGCSRDDEPFQASMANLLRLVDTYPSVGDECLALILQRYVKLPRHVENSGLLRMSVSLWGNPLHMRNRSKWDRVGEQAADMVRGWLKVSLIEDFFSHLSSDGAADRRRVEFWKRYAPYIDDMYFALGRDARLDRSDDATRLRNTMGDHLFRLESQFPKNNAFFMQIGEFIIVEFALTNNAAFVFERENLPFEFGPTIMDSGKRAWRERGRLYMLHHGMWEDEFARDIERVIRVRDPRMDRNTPGKAATLGRKPGFEEADLRAACLRHGVPLQQLSAVSYRVLASDRNSDLSAQLRSWGFKYHESLYEWTSS